MTEQLQIALDEANEFKKTGSNLSQKPIFGNDFKVESMDKPQQYLPRYQQDFQRPISFVENCNSCCGNFCICMAYPCALLCCKCCCVHELSTSSAGFVEQFGKFNRMLTPGFNMINPCTEEVRQISMKIQIITPGQSVCITKDNVKVTIDSSIAFRIINPIQVNYILGAQLNHAIAEATHSSIRNIVGQSILDEVLIKRSLIVQKARTLIMKNVPAGVYIENIFIDDIVIPQQTLKDLSSAAKQRRVSEATIINSKADVQSAGLLKQAAQLLDTKAAMQIRYLEMATELGKNGSTIIMPIGVNKKGYKQ